MKDTPTPNHEIHYQPQPPPLKTRKRKRTLAHDVEAIELLLSNVTRLFIHSLV